ncbi:MAG: phage portal protein [Verrucomicrobiota bacterium]
MIGWFSKKLSRKRGKREAFDAAKIGRLTADWITSPLSADGAIYGRLNLLRDRARDLERNNEWVRGFLRSLENNVLGENGIALQMRVRDGNGRMDETANQIIEDRWYQWGRVGSCTLNRRQSWRDVQKLVLRSIARDGEVMVRLIRQREGLRLQVLEADLLDLDYNRSLIGGNEVRFGVEFGADREVVAYHLLTRHPGDTLPVSSPAHPRVRIPANELMHLFLDERCDQTRGFPWLVASMKGLRMLDGYSDAELVAARTAASKQGFFVRENGEGYSGEEDGKGNLKMEASPGSFDELPPGVKFEKWDPSHPNQAFADFIKSRLRGVATSLGISYNTLTSDLENVNYSSIRAGLLEEREVWKALQRWLIEHFCEPIFEAWLEIELLSARMPLPAAKMWKFNMPEFRGRRWQWIDPKNDIEAAILGIRAGLTSQRDVIAQAGGDRFDVFSTIASDKEEAEKLGLKFPALSEPMPGAAAPSENKGREELTPEKDK